MAHFEDLSPFTYFGRWSDRLVAVGWLVPEREFVTGEVSREFFDALFSMLRRPWQPFATTGHEPCKFCRFTHGVTIIKYRGEEVSVGTNNLFVPDGNKAFVAPSLIVHYIDSHKYQPPAEFQAAVLRESSNSSSDLFKKMKSIGIVHQQ
jgi:hypothetical protein